MQMSLNAAYSDKVRSLLTALISFRSARFYFLLESSPLIIQCQYEDSVFQRILSLCSIFVDMFGKSSSDLSKSDEWNRKTEAGRFAWPSACSYLEGCVWSRSSNCLKESVRWSSVAILARPSMEWAENQVLVLLWNRRFHSKFFIAILLAVPLNNLSIVAAASLFIGKKNYYSRLWSGMHKVLIWNFSKSMSKFRIPGYDNELFSLHQFTARIVVFHCSANSGNGSVRSK